MDAVLVILSRWLHVVAGCLALGGVFVMRVVLPVGLRAIQDEALKKEVFLKCRRVFKMVIHTCILIFLVTGTYNAWLNWGWYHKGIPASHAFFGMHLLGALVVIGIALWALAGKEPPKAHAKAMLVNLVLLFFVVAMGSSLKYVRDKTMKEAAGAPGQPSTMPARE